MGLALGQISFPKQAGQSSELRTEFAGYVYSPLSPGSKIRSPQGQAGEFK